MFQAAPVNVLVPAVGRWQTRELRRQPCGQVVFFVGVQLDITLAPKQPSGTEAQKQARQALSLSEGRRRENAAMLQAAPEITQRAKQGQRSVVGTVGFLSLQPPQQQGTSGSAG